MHRLTATIHGWLLLLPAMALLALFTHWPALATFLDSFYSTPRPRRPAHFTGLDNYATIVSDPVFWRALWNNLLFAAGTIPVSIALAILMAIWVNDRIAGRTAIRMAYFTPTVLPMIAVANIWLFFYTPQYGLLEQITGALGFASHNWLGSQDTALAAVTIVAIWKEAGFFMIFYLAALQGIAPSLAEAAALEGASRWTFFRRVQFPLLMPTTLFVLINAVINAFRTVDHIIVMTRGGPDNATTLLLYYIYQVGFNFWDTTYAASLTTILLVLLGLAAFAQYGFLERPDPLPMSAPARSDPYAPSGFARALESAAAGLLAILWVLPLAYAVWAAFHPAEFTTRFSLFAPLTLDNFERAWAAAPFARYFLNTFILVTLILCCQLVLCTLAAYAFARYDFVGSNVAFALVLAQLMIMPDVLIVENYRTMSHIGIIDTIPAIALPYVASAFGIFLLRQTFKTIPKELDDAARVEGASPLQVLLKVYVPLARPIYVAYGLVSVSYHWNNFLWPLIVTNSVEARPLTVGLQVFSSGDQGIDWAIICAATLMTSGPLLLGFLLFQRQFVQSFMRAGIR